THHKPNRSPRANGRNQKRMMPSTRNAIPDADSMHMQNKSTFHSTADRRRFRIDATIEHAKNTIGSASPVNEMNGPPGTVLILGQTAPKIIPIKNSTNGVCD